MATRTIAGRGSWSNKSSWGVMKKYPFDKIPLVYVAGPYRSTTIWGVVQNIRNAQDVGLHLWRLGENGHPCMPFVPHMNSGLMDGAFSDELVLDADLAMLVRCNAVAMVPDWIRSSGAARERDIAMERAIPVFEWPDEVEKFLTWYKEIWPKSKYYLR